MTEDDRTPIISDPEGLVGGDEFPPLRRDERAGKMLVSPVWGNVARRVLTDHGEEATWVGSEYPEPCTLYAYARGYCMTGCKHPGMDITMPEGTELRAIAGGTVYMIRNPGRPGYIEVRVRTADRHEHLYNHMSRSVVAEGADVTAGQLLGYSGTNNSPHLHFELRIPNTDCDRGVAIVDPESLLRQSVAVDWKAGDRFQVTAELNLRAAAGTDSAVVALLPAGTTGTITGGPSSADGYTWWQVETSLGSGWVSQHRLEKRPDSAWMPGDQFTVTETLRLRAEAGTSSETIATLPAGTTGEIAGGPGTADGYTWWQVQTGLGNGWVAQDWLGRT